MSGGGIKEAEDESTAPWLDTIAAKVVMKVFYAARVARPDLLRAVGHLSCYLTRWSPECDRRLHRLMCYVHSTLDMKTYGWIGDSISVCASTCTSMPTLQAARPPINPPLGSTWG